MLQNLYQFLGRRTSFILVGSVLSGISFFIIEIALATLLQALFVSLDILPRTENQSYVVWETSALIASLFFVAVIKTAVRFYEEYSSKAILEVFRAHLRAKIAQWALSSRSVNSGKLFNLFSEKVTSSSGMLRSFQSTIIHASAGGFLLCYLFYLSWQITSVITILGLVSALLLRMLNRRIGEGGRQASGEWTKLSESLMVAVKHLLFLRIYSLQNSELQRILSRIQSYCSLSLRFAVIRGLQSSIPEFLGLMLIVIIAVYMNREPFIKEGIIFSYLYLLLRFFQKLSMTLSDQNTLIFYNQQIRELFNWWKSDFVRQAEASHVTQKTIKIQEAIGWDIQNMTCEIEGRIIIKSLEMQISPHDFLLVNGASGVGKSTFLSLLVGEAPEGNPPGISVRLGSKTYLLHEIDIELKKNLGYVGSEPYLIEGSLRENLIYGCEREVADDELEQLLKLSDCGFVFEKPLGLKHQITEQGEGLSTGQKQRLQIARALLRRPKALLLDEPTANLDREGEERIFGIIAKLKNEMTVVVASHSELAKQFCSKELTLNSDRSWTVRGVKGI